MPADRGYDVDLVAPWLLRPPLDELAIARAADLLSKVLANAKFGRLSINISGAVYAQDHLDLIAAEVSRRLGRTVVITSSAKPAPFTVAVE